MSRPQMFSAKRRVRMKSWCAHTIVLWNRHWRNESQVCMWQQLLSHISRVQTIIMVYILELWDWKLILFAGKWGSFSVAGMSRQWGHIFEVMTWCVWCSKGRFLNIMQMHFHRWEEFQMSCHLVPHWKDWFLTANLISKSHLVSVHRCKQEQTMQWVHKQLELWLLARAETHKVCVFSAQMQVKLSTGRKKTVNFCQCLTMLQNEWIKCLFFMCNIEIYLNYLPLSIN